MSLMYTWYNVKCTTIFSALTYGCTSYSVKLKVRSKIIYSSVTYKLWVKCTIGFLSNRFAEKDYFIK
jgi:hypothetical protein